MSLLRRHISTTARRRRIFAPLPAALVVLAAFGCVVGSATAASASSGPVVHAAAEEEQMPKLDLTLPGHGLISAEFTATVTIDYPSDGNPLTADVGDPLPSGRVVLERAASPLEDADALDDWYGGAATGSMVQLAYVNTEEITPGQTLSVDITADVSDDDDGVYPVVARFEPDTAGFAQELTDSAVLTRADDDPAVTVVVPITAPASSRGLLTSDQLEALTSSDGSLRNQLDAVDGNSAALAVDPAVPAAIRVLGSAAPASATEWLEDLMALPNDRFALQFGDADVATQIAASEEKLLAPTSLAPYIAGAGDVDDAGVGGDGAEPDPSPTPSVDPVDMSLDELLDIGDATDDIYWPNPDLAGAVTIERIDAMDGTSLVPSTTTKAGANGAPVAANAGEALVYDSGLSAEISEAATVEDGAARADALEKAVASLWLSSDELDGANLLVALERTGGVLVDEDEDAPAAPRPAAAVSDVVNTIADVSNTTLRSLTKSTRHDATYVGAGSPLRVDMSAALAEYGSPLEEISSVLSDPQLLLGRTRAERLQLLSVAWEAHPDAWRESFDSHLTSLGALSDAVGLVPPSDVNLLSSEAPLPVWVRNDLPYPVTVTVFSYPDDVRLSMDTSTEVVAQASSNTRVQLPVEATLGSGDVDIRISLQSPTGVLIGPEESMHVTVRADWERYGVAGLAALIVGLVVFGTIRTIRRRAKRTAPDDPVPDEHPDDVAHAEEEPDGQSR
ncbi:DUF6049 family protein [Microbacterium halotolerans]|uniref:DUF6049 family protein n=1 Tax=Microbacterium halotolerans TaxID=246613 RepID=UPI000E6AD579|nr:DUF6049 family protein [Microbacterium halotolerans]